MNRKRFIDLSIAIEADLPSDPPMMIPKIDYSDHAAGALQMLDFFPGVRKEDLPGSLGWAVEMITLATHSGTHLDAPYHYHPTEDGGKPSRTIDEIPLEWCMRDGVLLDFRHKADGERITAADVEAELQRIGYTIKPLDIVLIQTGADAAWGRPEYPIKGAGMTRESTLYLTEQGVRVVGIDAWSWDRPLPFLAREFQTTGNAKVIWRRTLPVSRQDTATWKRWRTSPPSADPSASRSAVSPSKSRKHRQGGAAPLPLFPNDQ